MLLWCKRVEVEVGMGVHETWSLREVGGGVCDVNAGQWPCAKWKQMDAGSPGGYVHRRLFLFMTTTDRVCVCVFHSRWFLRTNTDRLQNNVISIYDIGCYWIQCHVISNYLPLNAWAEVVMVTKVMCRRRSADDSHQVCEQTGGWLMMLCSVIMLLV